MRILIVLLGFIFGSFGSVLITRLSSNKLNKKEIRSIVFWFSQCPKCKERLKRYNLLPLLSYLRQKWKCSFCNKKISLIYPTIEILSWIVFLLTYIAIPYDNYWILFFRLIINRILLLLIIYDFRKYELHLPIFGLGILISLVFQFINITWNYKIAFLLSIFMLFAFLLIYFLSKLYIRYRYKKNYEWIWQWDVILSFFIWTLFSFVFQFNNIVFNPINIIQIIFVYIFLSAIIWIIIRIIKLLIKKGSEWSVSIQKYLEISWSDIIPFLPAMILSYRVLLINAQPILNLLFPW
jgi:prepilin signal peptidase PulO-like enzyme (type II secretory pathway)